MLRLRRRIFDRVSNGNDVGSSFNIVDDDVVVVICFADTDICFYDTGIIIIIIITDIRTCFDDPGTICTADGNASTGTNTRICSDDPGTTGTDDRNARTGTDARAGMCKLRRRRHGRIGR